MFLQKMKLQSLLVLIFLFLLAVPAQATGSVPTDLASQVDSSLDNAIDYYQKADRNYNFAGYDWVAFGLLSAGENLMSPEWTKVTKFSVFDYWASKIEKDLNRMDPGAIASIAICLMKAGYDPTDFAGEDLLAAIVEKQGDDGGMGKSDYGIFNHVLSMIALEMYNYQDPEYDRAAAIQFLKTKYDDFNKYGMDSVAFTLNVLPFLDGETAFKTQIIQQLTAAQNPNDGSYTYTGYDPETDFPYPPSPSPETVGEVLIGLKQVGVDVYAAPWNKSVQYLLDGQQDDGGFEAGWNPGQSDAYASSKVIVAIAFLHQNGPYYTDIDPTTLETYESAMPSHISLYDGFTSLIQDHPTVSSFGEYTMNSHQVYVRVDLQDIAPQAPSAVLVKAMKGNQVADLAVLEGSQAEKLTAGLQLAEGDYTIEVHYWNGLTGQPAVIKESDILAVKVQ